MHPVIQRSLLQFTAPLTMWQGLYSSLFYAKKRGKFLDRILLEKTDGPEPPAFHLVTAVQSRTGVKKDIVLISWH